MKLANEMLKCQTGRDNKGLDNKGLDNREMVV